MELEMRPDSLEGAILFPWEQMRAPPSVPPAGRGSLGQCRERQREDWVCGIDRHSWENQRANTEKQWKRRFVQVTGISVLTANKNLIWKLKWEISNYYYFYFLHLRSLSFLWVTYFLLPFKSNTVLKIFFLSLNKGLDKLVWKLFPT